jgi:hypothetical protein
VVTRLGPGSPAPAHPAEVEALLRLVPAVAFFPELDPLVPAPLGPEPLTPQAVARAVTEHDPTWLPRVVAALRSLEARAQATADGGLRFLAVTLRHFLDPAEGEPPGERVPPVERVPPAEHPLVVALFARTDARRMARPDHPSEVARVLDRW